MLYGKVHDQKRSMLGTRTEKVHECFLLDKPVLNYLKKPLW